MHTTVDEWSFLKIFSPEGLFQNLNFKRKRCRDHDKRVNLSSILNHQKTGLF